MVVMPRKPFAIKKPTGKPLLTINWKEVDRYLEAGCIGTEIAAFIGVSPDTLYIRTVHEKGMTFTAYQQQKKLEAILYLELNSLRKL